MIIKIINKYIYIYTYIYIYIYIYVYIYIRIMYINYSRRIIKNSTNILMILCYGIIKSIEQLITYHIITYHIIRIINFKK